MTGKPLLAATAPLFLSGFVAPEPYAARMAGLERRALSAGLTGFAVFQTRLPPGRISGLHHRHSKRDEFIYALEGEAVLFSDGERHLLRAGMCARFPAGCAHHLENQSDQPFVYLDITNAIEGDAVEFLEPGEGIDPATEPIGPSSSFAPSACAEVEIPNACGAHGTRL